MVKSRFSAASIHFLVSASVICILLGLIFFVWYPAPYFELSGTDAPVLVLIGVDLVIGPLLTLIIYDINKPNLKLDLLIIAVLQCSALLYGTYAVASQRPAFLAFDLGELDVITWADLHDKELLSPEIKESMPLIGPQLVWVKQPKNILAFLNSRLGGDDASYHAEWYSPISEASKKLKRKGYELTPEFFAENDRVRKAIEEAGRQAGIPIESLMGNRILPINGRAGEWSAVLDEETGELKLMVNARVHQKSVEAKNE